MASRIEAPPEDGQHPIMPNEEPDEEQAGRPSGIMIRLNPDEHKALAEMAQREHRNLNQQAAYIVAQNCRLGMAVSPETISFTGGAPPWFQMERATTFANIAKLAAEMEPAEDAIRVQNKALRLLSDTLDKLTD